MIALTNTLEREPESEVLVRFADCDPFNHLNNSKYIDYFLNAREDQLIKHYDLDIYRMAKETGLAWVVSQTQIAYLSSAQLMEKVLIRTRLISFSEKQLLVEALMLGADRTQVKSLMWMRLTHVNLMTQRSHAHAPALMAFFSEAVYPLEEASFEERLKGLNARG